MNLDVEFDKWKEDNIEELFQKFLESSTALFHKFVEAEWQKYQEKNGLIDESNKIIYTE